MEISSLFCHFHMINSKQSRVVEVFCPNVFSGLQDLMKDNHTEHPTTINVLERMNVYQEVFLASLYRTIPFVQVSFHKNGFSPADEILDFLGLVSFFDNHKIFIPGSF